MISKEIKYNLRYGNVLFTHHNTSCSIVRLSVLTMGNPNQLCDVLLFVCSNMADMTNLSSKLPVADRTREICGRKLSW